MHILVTDILACPRCGPRFGLILLADRIEGRRVLEGRLGCSNCREVYPVREGVGWFGASGSGSGGDATEGAIRLAALLGLGDGAGSVLLAGDAAAAAPAVAALVAGREVLAVNPPDTVRAGPVGDAGDRNGISILRVSGDGLPLTSAGLAGVALTGDVADRWLEEGARLVAPLGRLLVEPAPEDAAARVEAAGLRVLAHEGGTLVAGRVR